MHIDVYKFSRIVISARSNGIELLRDGGDAWAGNRACLHWTVNFPGRVLGPKSLTYGVEKSDVSVGRVVEQGSDLRESAFLSLT